MKTSIFIRTYEKDIPWLGYCLRSIQKFATGFHEVVIAIPSQQAHLLSHLTAEKIAPVHDGQPGYLGQQVDKLNADVHCEGDMVWNLDSDCVLTAPVNPGMFIVDGKARWLMTPWEDCLEVKKTWFHVMAKCLQEAPQHEFMRRHGIIVPRWAYQCFRDFIAATHDMPVDAYAMNQPGHEFSEFNVLGFYLWLHHRERIHWHNTSVDGIPPKVIDQAWSWGGMTDEYRNRMEALLA